MRDCPMCQTLWRKYKNGIAEHVAVENRLKVATLKRDDAVMEELTIATATALRDRDHAREMFRQHEATPHALVTAGTGIHRR